MRYLVSFSIIMISLFANSQSTHDKNYPMNRQGMNEAIIDDFSYPHYYKRFSGEIVIVDSTTIRFDEKTLFVYTNDTSLRIIFELGIIYPELFGGKTNNQLNSTLDSNSAQDDTNVIITEYKGKYSFESIFGGDSLSISNLKFSFSSISPNNRTIYFWLFRNGLMNPTEYWIELYNKNATKETDIETFIEGAKLISITQGSLLI